MTSRIIIITMVGWVTLSSVPANATDNTGGVVVVITGRISRGDGITLAADRMVWFEVRNATGQVIGMEPSTNGTYSWEAPPGFAGSIRPIHPDITFEPPLISYAGVSPGDGGSGDEGTAEFTAFYSYHVDVDGVSGFAGNDENAGTASTPLGTVQEAVDRAMPGDTVLIRGGIYRQDRYPDFEVVPIMAGVRSGTASHPITIRNFDPKNETVIFDAEEAHLEAVEIEGFDYITIEGIIGERAKTRVFHIIDSNNIILRDCTARDNVLGNLPGFSLRGRSWNCLLERCVSTRNGRGFLLTGTVETQDPSQENRPRFNTIRRCLAFGNIRDEEDSDGFQILAGSDNLIDRCLAFDNGDDGFDFTRGSHRNRITNSVSFAHPHAPGGMGDGNGFKIGVWGQAPSDSQGGGVNCVMRNCAAFGNKVGLTNNAVGLQVYNCQFNNNRRFGLVFDESTGHDGQAILFNNLIFGNGEQEAGGRDVIHNSVPRNPVQTSDFNYIGDGSSTNDHPDEVGHEAHSIVGETQGPPGLINQNNAGLVIDVTAPDFPFATGFRLAPNSILIDAGLSVGQEYPAVEFPDIAPNVGFPGANVYDIGVYEFISDDPDAVFLIQCQSDCDCVLGPVSQAHEPQTPSDIVDMCDYQYCDTDGFCSSCARRFGNQCGSLSDTVQTNDLLCAINGFGDYCACPNADVWNGGAPGCDREFAPELCKGPSGLPIGTDDLLAAISAFGGNNPFGCDLNPNIAVCDDLELAAPVGCSSSVQVGNAMHAGTTGSSSSGDDPASNPGTSDIEGILKLVPRQRVITAGSTLEVDVFVSGQDRLTAYQAGIITSGGAAGTLELNDIDVHSDRADHVFAGFEKFAARDRNEFRVAGFVLGDGVDVPADQFAYLATFKLRSTADARGVFVLKAHPEHTSLWTSNHEAAPPYSSNDTFVVILVPDNDPR